MVLLDTDVVSAVMRPKENPSVVAWLDRQDAAAVWITAVTLLEGRFGLSRMADGKRRNELTARFERLVFGELAGHILPFDKDAAERAALVSVLRRGADRKVEYHDIQIAGIALARNASLATRNTRDFQGLNLLLINPWEA